MSLAKRQVSRASSSTLVVCNALCATVLFCAMFPTDSDSAFVVCSTNGSREGVCVSVTFFPTDAYYC